MTKRFIMVDGLDGSGKGTAVAGLKEWAEKKGLKVLDLKEFCEEHSYIPEFEEVKDYDAIVSMEPTYAYVGKAIREEIIRDNSRKYSGTSIMHAFALDRKILYQRLILPALKNDKFVFQERGVVSSIVYQPAQENIMLSELLRVPGNKLALEHAPGLLIITRVEPEVVVGRLEKRGKKDNSIFDNLTFQRKIHDRYHSDWLRLLFEAHSSSVVYLDTNPPKTPEDTKQDVAQILEGYLAAKRLTIS